MKLRSKFNWTFSIVVVLVVSSISSANAETTPAKAPATTAVKLTLTEEIKSSVKVEDGTIKTIWQPIDQSAHVNLGDEIRYKVIAVNQSGHAVTHLNIIEPIPTGTIYVPASATTLDGHPASVAYSIDNGGAYSPSPVVLVTNPDGTKVQAPAPVSKYTHVRWTFTTPLPKSGAATVSYSVKVR